MQAAAQRDGRDNDVYCRCPFDNAIRPIGRCGTALRVVIYELCRFLIIVSRALVESVDCKGE